MNKTLLLLLAGGLLLTACKKGEDDPFLSLKSRDARIRGEWKMTERTYSDNDGNSETFDGTTYTITENGETEQFPYSATYTIEKHGTIEFHIVRDGVEHNSEGYWGWQNTNKKKSSILINNNYYQVKRLSNKELVLEQNYTAVEDGYEETYSRILKFEKQ
jgi:hypothetical protein